MEAGCTGRPDLWHVLPVREPELLPGAQQLLLYQQLCSAGAAWQSQRHFRLYQQVRPPPMPRRNSALLVFPAFHQLRLWWLQPQEAASRGPAPSAPRAARGAWGATAAAGAQHHTPATAGGGGGRSTGCCSRGRAARGRRRRAGAGGRSGSGRTAQRPGRQAVRCA